MAYDQDNIFAKILRQEIPCEIVFENEHVIAFEDLYPKAPTHLLVIPKGAYTNMDDFTANATPEEMAGLFKAVGDVARMYRLNEGGYRVISNCGVNGGQEVLHLHIHILGGAPIGAMVSE